MNDRFTRDGHISDLTLERIHAGEIRDDAVMAHLEICTLCQDRLAALTEHDRTFQLPPPMIRPPKPSRLNGQWVAPVAAIAAAVLLYFGAVHIPDNSTPVPLELAHSLDPASDTYRIKGSLNVEFSIKRGDVVKTLSDGDTVHPGDRIGFRVATPKSGHLMIVGLDGRDEPYLCYPQSNQGRSQIFGPSKDLANLNEAIVLDDILGSEELVAVFCAQEVKYKEIVSALKRRRVQPGQTSSRLHPQCRERKIVVKKALRLNP